MWHHSFCLTQMRLNVFTVVLDYSGSCGQYEAGDQSQGVCCGETSFLSPAGPVWIGGTFSSDALAASIHACQ
jgi:hypothetical protein